MIICCNGAHAFGKSLQSEKKIEVRWELLQNCERRPDETGEVLTTAVLSPKEKLLFLQVTLGPNLIVLPQLDLISDRLQGICRTIKAQNWTHISFGLSE